MKQLLFHVTSEDQLESFFRQISSALSEKTTSLLFHFYCGSTDQSFIDRVRASVLEHFPEAAVMGTTSNGEILKGHLTPQGLLLGVLIMEGARITVHSFPELKGNEERIGKEVLKLITETPDCKAVELLLEGPPADTTTLLGLIQRCRESICIFGGYSIGHDINADKKFQITTEGIRENSLAVALYSGAGLHVNSDYTLGWVPLGHAFRITKCKGNLLMEIDGMPAYDIYRKYLQIKLDEHSVENTTEFPLLVRQGKTEFLRHPNECLPDGTMALSGYVREGMDVYLTYGNPTKIIEQVDRRLGAIREFEPEAIILHSCALRKSFWLDFVDKEVEPCQRIAETGGFYTGGELLRLTHTGQIMEFNLTLVSIAMREGEKKGTVMPDALVDDSMLSGQASLLKRLANLVQITTSELVDTNEKFAKMAITDALTGLYNRGEMEKKIGAALDASEILGQRSSLIMLDIDHFKAINDSFGHAAGDHALKEIAKILRRYADEDMGGAAGRWGGEEFFLLLPGTESSEAMHIAETMRREIETHDFGEAGRVTVSMGVLTSNGTENRRQVFISVDEALYQAKSRGRNQVVMAELQC